MLSHELGARRVQRWFAAQHQACGSIRRHYASRASRAISARGFFLTFAGGLALWSFSSAAAVQYVYDAAGRLSGVIDQSGNVAIYNYDANGNITSIVRPASGAVSVLGFAPASGPVGTSVTITGAGFSTTASQNTVKFNGTTATVVSATANQIVATVPGGATTGTVTVTAPGGSATSTQSFTVTTAAAGPTISSFTPTSGGYGDTVTISGTGFGTSAALEQVQFGGANANITATTPTSITVAVPAGGTTGPITVVTQGGSATSSASFYVIPGGYTNASVGATTTSSYTTLPANQAATVTVSNSSKVYLYKFSGTAGQRVSAAILDGSNLTADVMAFGPDGTLLAGPIGSQYFSDPTNNFVAPGALLGPFTLPTTGTYTIEVIPDNGTTGSTQVAIYQVPADLSGTLISGQTISVNLNTPGQKAAYTFPRPTVTSPKALIQFTSTKSTNYEFLYSLINPNGSTIDTFGPEYFFQPNMRADQGPFALSQSGNYTVSLVGNQAYTVNTSLLYLQFPPSAATNITTNGTAVTTPALANGQNTLYYFDGTAGQRIAMDVPYVMQGGGLYNNLWITLFAPDGTTIATSPFTGTGTYYLPTTTLAQTGRYTILMASTAQTTGTATLYLYSVPVDATATLVAGGSSQSDTVSTPGQSMDYTFTGAANQKISFTQSYTVTNGQSGSGLVYAKIFNPDGSVFQDLAYISSGTVLGPFTLVQAGTYKLVLTPQNNGTGSSTVQLYTVPADPSKALTLNGSSQTDTTTVYGQNAVFTFSGTATHQATFHVTYTVTNGPSGSGLVSGQLLNPDGSQAQSISFFSSPGTLGAYTLAQTGTYKLVLTPQGEGIGSITTSVTGN